MKRESKCLDLRTLTLFETKTMQNVSKPQNAKIYTARLLKPELMFPQIGAFGMIVCVRCQPLQLWARLHPFVVAAVVGGTGSKLGIIEICREGDQGEVPVQILETHLRG